MVAAPAARAQEAASQSAPAATGVGLGDLLVAPTRIVFEGRDRTAEITLVNIGEKRATYRIGFVQLRMGDDGKLSEIEEAGPGEKFADELVRFSPRQVTLDPTQSQTVRLQVRKPGDLPAGEYRSHLLLRGIPDVDEMKSNVESERADGISIRLIPIYGVSIPVIVREGDVSATAEITDLSFEPATATAPPTVRFRVNRSGNGSLYGVFKATLIPAAGKEQVVAITGGYSVYVPNAVRIVEIPLTPPPEVQLRNAVLRITYLRGDANGEAIAGAETRLP
jgi:hypothetical protein